MSGSNFSHELETLINIDFENAVEALDSQVHTRGNKIAVRVGETGETLTYAELGKLTDAFAGSLVGLGIQPGDRVAVVSEAPLTSVITMYGTWKAGAVFAPINPEYSGDYLTYHLNDCGAKVVVSSPHAAERVGEIRRTVIEHFDLIVDEESEMDSLVSFLRLSSLIEGTGRNRPEVTLKFNQPASIIYTSGTTGPAKGVVQSHRWINQYSWQYRRWMNDEDIIHVDLPMYHVGAAFFNVVRALWVGASVSLWKRFSATQYWQRINSAGATCTLLFDVMVPWLLQQPESSLDKQNTLRYVHMQPLPANHREFAQRFGVDWVTAGFGQTESGSAIYGLIDEFPDDDNETPPHLRRGLTKKEMRDRTASDGALIVRGESISGRGFMGRATPFLEVQIHDTEGRRCEVGAIGELVIRPQLPSAMFSMYLGKPDYSLHAFRDLWFHTGDTAFQDESGAYYYCGRLGERIRVKGENISAFDIEQQALAHASVHKAAAIGVPSSQGEEDEIVLFIELVPNSGNAAQSIQDFLLTRLSRHMQPQRVVIVDSMPVTQTNKVQKHKLRGLLESSISLSEPAGG